MTNFTDILGANRRTSMIVRDGADPAGLRRLVFDEVAILAVRAFPFADIPEVAAGGQLAKAGAYLLADQDIDPSVYIGESGNIGRRLQEHFNDPSKQFANEVFVIAPQLGDLEKQAVVHLQKRLSELAKAAGTARLIAGVGPCNAGLAPYRASNIDRMLADALTLFVDAGCRCLVPTPRGKAVVPVIEGSSTVATTTTKDEPVEDVDDDELMEIGVTTVPIGVEELELAHGDLWARGYDYGDRFVAAAGSEMRSVPNSVRQRVLDRRQSLVETKTAVAIPSVTDRLRLTQAVAFPSRATAAMVLTGTHVGSDRWRPLPAGAPFVVAC